MNLYSIEMFKIVQIKEEEKTEKRHDGLIIRDQMTNLGAFMVCASGNLLLPLLVVAYTLNKTEIGIANERYIGNHDDNDFVGHEVQQGEKFL